MAFLFFPFFPPVLRFAFMHVLRGFSRASLVLPFTFSRASQYGQIYIFVELDISLEDALLMFQSGLQC